MLHFTATAGSIRLTGAAGEPQADIAIIDYQLDVPDRRARGVTFVLNGGPGAASAWLQLGALGPWRLPLSGDAGLPSAVPDLVPNADTWLDFTDLVFIDPVGTGYSEFARADDEVRRRLWSVEGDIQSLAEVIRRWLEKNGRLVSPNFPGGRELWRLPRAAAGAGLANRRGHRDQRPCPRLPGPGFRRPQRGLRPSVLGHAPAEHGGGGPRRRP